MFVTRENETYQLQRSTDLMSWENIPNEIAGDESENPAADPSLPVKGNNGPVAFVDNLTTDKAYYRLLQTKI